VVNAGRTGYEFANQPTIPDHSIYVQTVNNEEPDGGGDVTLTTELINEVAPNLYYTDTRFDTRYATKTHYHDRYATEAEAERSGATATLEIYYTARPDGDGYAESEVSDVGETDTINRTLFYSTKFEADPDTAGDWTQYATQPADNATFATAKAALLAGLNDTDATAETRGTLPLSLKMVRTTTAPVTDLLLDDYPGAAAAYSVRKLDQDYTGYCMKVREDSGDTEADIGFDGSGDLDTAAIATHCGSANGYVVTWYDQSGNANNATQSTSGNQPQIYNGTAVITENGKPALQLGRSTLKQLTTSAISWGTSITAATVLQPTDDGNFYIKNWSIGTDATTRGYAHITMTGANAIDWTRDDSAMFGDGYAANSDPRIVTTGSAFTSGQQALSFLSLNSTASTLHVDGTEPTYRVQETGNTSADSDILYINGGTSAGQGMDGTMQELIFWASDESSNRTGIQTDINTYFSIY
jgi:hypothetical protein